MKMDHPFVIVGDAGNTIWLTHPAAQWVVKQGNGVYVDGGEEPGPSREELERQELEYALARTSPKVPDDFEQPGTLPSLSEPVTLPAEPAEEIKRPYGNSPKSAWVRYAISVDENLTQERAEGMTKADLMSRYGERLLDSDL